MRELWQNGHFFTYPQGQLLHMRFFFFLMRHVGVLGIIVGQFRLERTKAGVFFLYHLYIEILVGMEEITEMLFFSAGTICFHFVFM